MALHGVPAQARGWHRKLLVAERICQTLSDELAGAEKGQTLTDQFAASTPCKTGASG